ncbi:MAG: transposase [Saprospiraceae bacterium]
MPTKRTKAASDGPGSSSNSWSNKSQVEQAIEGEVGKDPELKAKVEAVCTLKGVGLITAATVIAETNGFALFRNKAQLVSYAGVRCGGEFQRLFHPWKNQDL